MRAWCIIFAVALSASAVATSGGPAPLRVGSKAFTESVVLGEVAAQVVRGSGVPAVHERALGGTRLLWNALVNGQIDVYPEYTGTLQREVLAGQDVRTPEQLADALRQSGIGMTRPLGFDNTYAIGVRPDLARRLGLSRISDLQRHPELRFGFSNEFMDRSDGWPLLRQRYQLSQHAHGMDHDLAYRAMESGAIDATDLYSTDAEIDYYHLTVLQDDLHVFPEYKAVYLYRIDLEPRDPGAISALHRLEGRIDVQQMRRMNAQVKLEHRPEAMVASDFLASALGLSAPVAQLSTLAAVWQRTREHLLLVGISLLAAIVAAVPLGIFAARHPKWGQVVLGVIAAIYTIPSLALLVFMIPLLGIGTWPAIAALFLYSLLPIVRNTHAGLVGIAPAIRESAAALGLPPWARLVRVELPIALPAILAGIQTSAVINVGTATLGALIGAGGYGQSILTGIRLDDVRLILEGAVPAAGLALLAQGAFGAIGWALVPRGLRSRPQRL